MAAPPPTPAPAAAAAAALAAALAIPSLYVALLYAPPFHARGLPRDHPATVARRFCACAASCALAVALLLAIERLFPRPAGGDPAAPPPPPSSLRLLGLAPPRPWPAFLAPPLLALLPYAPTGLARWLARPRDQQPPPRRRRRGPLPPPLLLLRDLAVAPLTEELAFRAAATPLLARCLGARLAPWVSPLLFSLAHAHHHLAVAAPAAAAPAAGFGGGAQGPGGKAALARGRRPWLSLRSGSRPLLLQLGYTYAFGLFASLMLVATGSLPGVVAAHALCNALGLPGGAGGGGATPTAATRTLVGAVATAGATAAMVAAMAVFPGGALDAARWFGGGLLLAPAAA